LHPLSWQSLDDSSAFIYICSLRKTLLLSPSAGFRQIARSDSLQDDAPQRILAFTKEVGASQLPAFAQHHVMYFKPGPRQGSLGSSDRPLRMDGQSIGESTPADTAGQQSRSLNCFPDPYGSRVRSPSPHPHREEKRQLAEARAPVQGVLHMPSRSVDGVGIRRLGRTPIQASRNG
jgi:hypothetical protein